MKKRLKELTEGMQRLCAVANRIVSENGPASRIEIDLLLDNLRSLYDIALQLADERVEGNDDELISSTMMATRAAMQANTEVKTAAVPAATIATEQAKEPVKEQSELPAEEPESVLMEESAVTADGTSTQQSDAAVTEAQQPDTTRIVEEYEAAENGLLFDEIIIESEAQPEPEEAAQPESEKAAQPEPEAEPESEIVVEPTAEPEPEVAAEKMAVPEEPATAKPTQEAKQEANIHSKAEFKEETQHHASMGGQASLLDFLKEAPAARTLGETLGNVGANPLERKVSDLRTVININDKFSFITDLFHGNMRGYNDFIMQLSETDDRDTAMAMVGRVAEQQRWSDDMPAVKAFYKILEKKF